MAVPGAPVSGYTDGYAWGTAMGKAASEGNQAGYLYATNSQNLFYRGQGEEYCSEFALGWQDGLAKYNLRVSPGGETDGGVSFTCP